MSGTLNKTMILIDFALIFSKGELREIGDDLDKFKEHWREKFGVEAEKGVLEGFEFSRKRGLNGHFYRGD